MHRRTAVSNGAESNNNSSNNDPGRPLTSSMSSDDETTHDINNKDNEDDKYQKQSKSYISVPIFIVAAIVLFMLCTGLISHNKNGSNNLPSSSVRKNNDASNQEAKSVSNSDNNDLNKKKYVADYIVDNTPGPHYHVIFSTGCSIYQDWQSYMFFFSAKKSKQPGYITRIVSGCDAEEQDKLQRLFDETIQPMSPSQFRIHFTPDFAHIKGKYYPYFNKPFGTKHWFENAMGYPDNPIDDDAIVILMDPDQIILRPFTNNDFSNTIWRFENDNPRTQIVHGGPMGQLYGFGTQWKSKINMALVAPTDEQPSPVEKLTNTEARNGYVVGPPYIATARDLYAISSKWSSFVQKVHDQYPYLLAEMFAYCLAAAHLNLPHQIAASFMVSDTGTDGSEGWEYVNNIPDEDICVPQDVEKLPNVIHFCQRYSWGPYFFGKRLLPGELLSCNAPLLAPPPTDLLTKYTSALYLDKKAKELQPKEAKKMVFMLCYIINTVNEALMYFKQHNCEGKKTNFNQTLVFVDDFGPDYTVYHKTMSVDWQGD